MATAPRAGSDRRGRGVGRWGPVRVGEKNVPKTLRPQGLGKHSSFHQCPREPNPARPASPRPGSSAERGVSLQSPPLQPPRPTRGGRRPVSGIFARHPKSVSPPNLGRAVSTRQTENPRAFLQVRRKKHPTRSAIVGYTWGGTGLPFRLTGLPSRAFPKAHAATGFEPQAVPRFRQRVFKNASSWQGFGTDEQFRNE